MTARDLVRLTRKRLEAEDDWRNGIRQAHAEGMSLRTIADCVGVVHTRVYKIVRGA